MSILVLFVLSITEEFVTWGYIYNRTHYRHVNVIIHCVLYGFVWVHFTVLLFQLGNPAVCNLFVQGSFRFLFMMKSLYYDMNIVSIE